MALISERFLAQFLWMFLLGACSAQRTPQKTAHAYCTYNELDQSITLHVLFDTNGDVMDKLLVIDGPAYTGSNEAMDCVIQTLDAERRSIESAWFINGNVKDNDCGGRFSTVNGNEIQLELTVEARERFNDDYYTEMDRHYSISCSMDQATPGLISTSVLIGQEAAVAGTRIRPETIMRYLVADDLGVFDVPDATRPGVSVNERIQLQIESKLNQSQPAAFQVLGVYPYSCSWYNTPPARSPIVFMDTSGCPTSQFGFTRGFEQSSVNTATRTFYTDTEPFVLFTSNPPAPVFVFECVVNFCFLETDQKCINFCASNGRKRRDAPPQLGTETVSVTINVMQSDVSPSDSDLIASDESISQTTIIAVSVSIVVIVIAVLAVVVGVCVFLRKQREERERREKRQHLTFYNMPIKY